MNRLVYTDPQKHHFTKTPPCFYLYFRYVVLSVPFSHGSLNLSSRVLHHLSVESCVELVFPLLWLDYTVMRGTATSRSVAYRCWPSYSQQGCLLSVHSAREAAYICNSHSQCNSFTLTGQKTWTGELKYFPLSGLYLFFIIQALQFISLGCKSDYIH